MGATNFSNATCESGAQQMTQVNNASEQAFIDYIEYMDKEYLTLYRDQSSRAYNITILLRAIVPVAILAATVLVQYYSHSTLAALSTAIAAFSSQGLAIQRHPSASRAWETGRLEIDCIIQEAKRRLAAANHDPAECSKAHAEIIQMLKEADARNTDAAWPMELDAPNSRRKLRAG